MGPDCRHVQIVIFLSRFVIAGADIISGRVDDLILEVKNLDLLNVLFWTALPFLIEHSLSEIVTVKSRPITAQWPFAPGALAVGFLELI